MNAENSAYTHSSFLHFLQELLELEWLSNRVQYGPKYSSMSLPTRCARPKTSPRQPCGRKATKHASNLTFTPIFSAPTPPNIVPTL
ncbi:hypothetical protein V1506DRAFT_540902 [Lipomyces tetrasporus]